MGIYFVSKVIWDVKILSERAQKIIEDKMNSLMKSKFRSSFHLHRKELAYIDKCGIDKIKNHAYEFINVKLKPANPINDGAQTPMKNHPVFIAQHATATCCRGCLEKWHHIPKGRELSDNEINYIVALIMTWIIKNYK